MEKNKDGIVIRGAFLLDTQGATADVILVFPAPFSFTVEEESPYSFAYAVPSNLEGISFLCRESFVGGESTYNDPLSSRLETGSSYAGMKKWHAGYWMRVIFHTYAGTQIICKNIAKTEFLLGMIDMLVKTAGLESHGHVIEKVTEVIVALETLKAFQLAAEKGASPDRWGNMLPARKPLLAANVYFQQVYPRMIEIVQLIGASNLIMIQGAMEKYRDRIQDFLS